MRLVMVVSRCVLSRSFSGSLASASIDAALDGTHGH
jgi:hypothetical protein